MQQKDFSFGYQNSSSKLNKNAEGFIPKTVSDLSTKHKNSPLKNLEITDELQRSQSHTGNLGIESPENKNNGEVSKQPKNINP